MDVLLQIIISVVGFCLGAGLAYWIYKRRTDKVDEAPAAPNVHLVVAGNFQQFRYWAERNFSNAERNHMRYLSRAQDIRGYHGPTVQLHLIGTYYERPDYTDIQAYTVPYAKDHGILMPAVDK